MNSFNSFSRTARLLPAAVVLLSSLSGRTAQFSFPSFPELFDGVAAGYGVNAEAVNPADLLLAKAITFSISTGPTNTGRFMFNLETVHSSSDVLRARSASAEIEGRYLMYSGKASFDVAVASHTTTDTVMWIVSVDKDYGVREQLTNTQLTDAAKARLKNDGYEKFVRQFGDRFISAWSRKAHLEVIFEAYNITEEDQQHVDAMIQASAEYAAGSASGRAKISNEFRSLSSSARTRVSFSADGLSVDNYFKGITDLTSLDQMQKGIASLLSDIDGQNGTVAQYYTTAYADIFLGFPLVPPFPTFPELKKAQDAFEQAYTVKLKAEAIRRGPRGPFLDANELTYLSAKTAECDARIAGVQKWLGAFDQDHSLRARIWPEIDSTMPDLKWYAAQRIQLPAGFDVFPVSVTGGTEVGDLHFFFQASNNGGYEEDVNATIRALWPSANAIQVLNSPDKLNQARDPKTGSVRRWFFGYESSTDRNAIEQWKEYSYAQLRDKAGNPINYAKEPTGRYVVTSVKIGRANDPWPGPNGDTINSLFVGGYTRIARPIDGAVFGLGELVTLEAEGVANSVFFSLDGVKIPGQPAAGVPKTGGSCLFILTNAVPGSHILTITAAGNSSLGGFTLAPITFTVTPPTTPPLITTQPQPVNSAPGDTVAFRVTANGAGPLAYAWQRNGQEIFDNARISGSDSSVLTISSVASSDAGNYSVVVSNPVGSATSSPAILKFKLDPDPSYHPADANKDWSLNLGEVLAYATSFKKGTDWAVGPNPIPLGYVIRGFTLYKTGERYKSDPSVGAAPASWVSDGAKPQSLMPPNQQPVRKSSVGKLSPAGGAAMRQLPSQYTPGTPVAVSIVITPASGGSAYGVEETPPAGWMVTAINESGAFDAAKNKVKWTFLDNNSRTLTYQATPPANGIGTVSFGGAVNFDGVKEIAIAGQSQIGPVTHPPPIEPPTVQPPPTTPPGSTTTGAAVRQLPLKYTPGMAVTVSIAVSPNNGILAYGVEEQPPTGWAVSGVNESGAFDSTKGKVKWTFLDNTTRTLTYQATPPTGATGVATFGGTVNFDGVKEVTIAGQLQIETTTHGDDGQNSPAVRQKPPQFAPGNAATVSIVVTPPNGVFAYGVEETPPAGWTVSGINESGAFDAAKNKVKWTFLDNTPRTLTYQVTPPVGNTGTPAFTGTINFDGVKEVAIIDPDPTTRTLQISEVSGSPGASVVIPITVIASGNENAISFSLAFAPGQATFGNVVLGGGASGASLVVNSNEAASGKIGVVISLPVNQSIPKGNQTLATLTVNLAAGLQSGTIIPIRFTDSPALKSVSDSLGGDLTANFVDGFVKPADGYEGDVAPRPNGNRLVNAADVTIMGRVVAGLEASLTPPEFQRADCAPRSTFGNGAINAGDLTQVSRYVAGLDPQTSIGGPTRSSVGSQTVAEGSGKLAKKSLGIRRLSVLNASTAPGGNITFPIQIIAQGNENALSFSLYFDAAKLSFVNASIGTGPVSGNLVLNTDAAQSGKIGVVISLPVNQNLAAGTLELLKVTLRAGDAVGSVPIAFTNSPAPQSTSDTFGNDLENQFVDGTITIQPGGPLSLEGLRLNRGVLEATLSGLVAGATVELQSSSNLRDWILIQTYTASGTTLPINRVVSPGSRAEFLRAVVK